MCDNGPLRVKVYQCCNCRQAGMKYNYHYLIHEDGTYIQWQTTSILYPDNGVCLCVTDVGGSSGKVCPVGLQVQCRSEC